MKIPKILRVLYSPSKVFEELAEKPSYKGVILILILFIILNTLAVYTLSTKQYVQRVKPDSFTEGVDIWTENATLWKSNVNCTRNSDEKVCGEYSIAFNVTNIDEVYMQISFPESINCSRKEFNQTSFSLKLVGSDTAPSSISLKLFSTASEYFMRDLEIASITNWNDWNCLNASLGIDEGWETEGNASWHIINGAEITVKFPENVNATLLLDTLVFQGQYEPQVSYFIYSALLYIAPFTMFWITSWVLLHLLTKYAGSNLTWKHNLMISGYSLTPTFVRGIFLAIIFLFLPVMNYQINVQSGNYTLKETPTVVELIFSLYSYSQVAFLAWGIIILTFAVRTLNNFTTGKSVIISLAAYLVAFLLAGFPGL